MEQRYAILQHCCIRSAVIVSRSGALDTGGPLFCVDVEVWRNKLKDHVNDPISDPLRYGQQNTTMDGRLAVGMPDPVLNVACAYAFRYF